MISQVYGAGGNAHAALKNDFVELLNRGTAPGDGDGDNDAEQVPAPAPKKMPRDRRFARNRTARHLRVPSVQAMASRCSERSRLQPSACAVAFE